MRTGEKYEADLAAYARELSAVEREMRDANPDLPYITVAVMAGDLLSMRNARRRIDAGEDPEKCMNLVGSFARFAFAVDLLDEGIISEDAFFSRICELWRGADPDDTDPRFLTLWRDAVERNDGVPLYDETPVPPTKWLTVYRGQRAQDKLGIAWTTDLEIARKFAGGASYRTRVEGVVLKGRVRSALVFAYITERGESEVIVDPSTVRGIDEFHG